MRRLVDSVFRAPVYDRSVSGTLWRRIGSLIAEALRAIFRSLDAVPELRWVIVGAGAALVIAIAARAIYASTRATGTRAVIRVDKGRDPWNASAEAAAAGRYIDAAHLLYLALIEAVAGRERLRLHPAKTIGDYTRDLRRSSSPTLPAFGEFARLYQPIVWGSRECDRSSYERLHSIAESVRDAA